MVNSLPDTVKQEIKNTLAIHARELCMRGKAGGITVKNQHQFLFKSVHGSPGGDGIASLIDSFLAGKHPCEKVFECLPIENNREGNELCQGTGHMLEMTEVLHCHIGMQLIVHERGFTRKALAEAKDGQIWPSRNINDRALQVAANYKHALRFYKEHSGSAEKDNPSGKKFEDMLRFVRQKMFVFCQGCKSTAASKRSKKTGDEALTEDDMPTNCMFTGQLAFCLLGPQAVAGISLSALSPDGENVPKQSRRKAEAQQKVADDAERAVGEGGHVPKEHARGVPLQEKSKAAGFAQKEWMEERQHVRELLFIKNQNHAVSLAELKTAQEMIRSAKQADTEDGEDTVEQLEHLCNWRNSVYKQLEELRESKKHLEEQSQQLMKQAPKKAMTACMEQLGNFHNSPAGESSRPETIVLDGTDASTRGKMTQTQNTQTPMPPSTSKLLQQPSQPSLQGAEGTQSTTETPTLSGNSHPREEEADDEADGEDDLSDTEMAHLDCVAMRWPKKAQKEWERFKRFRKTGEWTGAHGEAKITAKNAHAEHMRESSSDNDSV